MKRSKRTLMIVDDEHLYARAASDELADLGLEIVHVETRRAALDLASDNLIDVVLLDQRLPDGDGAEICPPLIEANELCKIIIVTAFPNFDSVVQALRGGAFDYLVKPCDPEALKLAVRRCLKTLDLERSQSAHERNRMRAAEDSVPYFGPTQSGTRRVLDLAARVDSPVLLTGETGTGKSLVARAIHFNSPRRGGEFVAVNCAALPETLIEAELLGYERGSFTGSAGPREGLFEMADGGTILLDEITELPLHLQARLLHVLEDRTLRRLGGRTFRRVDFRLIAATNVNPEVAMESHQLRQDLFHRLHVLPIHLAPLRERLDDLPELAMRLLRGLGANDAARRISPRELELLTRYDWPGNVRELRNVLERALLVSDGGPLRPSQFLHLQPESPSRSDNAKRTRGAANLAPLEVAARLHIESALRRCEGNVSAAARLLGISRSTLRRRLRTSGS